MTKTLTMVAVLTTLAVHPASAGVCTVNDPTGTPLNVRDEPYGRIIGALNNGTEVFPGSSMIDKNGRTWIYVITPGPGKSGWVYKQYIDCD